MKDNFVAVLLVVAVVAIGWAFWHFMGGDSFSAITMLAAIVLLADNFRLRQSLKNKSEK